MLLCLVCPESVEFAYLLCLVYPESTIVKNYVQYSIHILVVVYNCSVFCFQQTHTQYDILAQQKTAFFVFHFVAISRQNSQQKSTSIFFSLYKDNYAVIRK
jgi:hypothetical protein